MRYSLAKYVLSITPSSSSSEIIAAFGNSLSIGGNGSNVGDINVSRSTDMFSIKTYATGGYVIDKNLSKAGSISISIHQLSAEIQKFIKVCNAYFQGDYDGVTLTIMNGSNEVVSAKDCFINQAPQRYAESSTDQTWTFVCGEIDFKPVE